MAHGSKNPEWAEPFRQMAATLRKDMGNEAVYLCFLEIAKPNLLEVAEEIMKTSVRQCRLLPMFMAQGGHFDEDIPAQIAEIQNIHQGLEVELLQPIGLHPLFFELMCKVIKAL